MFQIVRRSTPRRMGIQKGLKKGKKRKLNHSSFGTASFSPRKRAQVSLTEDLFEAKELLLNLYSYADIMNCEFNNGAAAALATMLFVMNFFIIMKELFQFRSHPRKYFKMPTNWAQIALLILSFISGYPAFFNGHDIQTWQIYLASVRLQLS